MKSLIIYKSIHNKNTERIARRMAKILNADLIEPDKLDFTKIGRYDVVGFGSGIYSGKHHESILDIVGKLPDLKGKKVFVFSTSALIRDINHQKLRKKLVEKNARIVDEFFCKGFNKKSFLKYIGGMNRRRPNEEDFKRAEDFARKIITE